MVGKDLAGEFKELQRNALFLFSPSCVALSLLEGAASAEPA